MSARRTTALVIATLVLGIVVGNVAGIWAAPQAVLPTSAAAAACNGLGLRMGGAMRDAGGRLSDIVAKLTGQEVADVQAKRAEGKSFADIAAEKGVKSSAIVDEALKVREEALKAKVADGTITQQQADAALAAMRDRLTQRVDSTQPGCGMGGGGRGRGMGRGAGACGGGCVSAPTAQ